MKNLLSLLLFLVTVTGYCQADAAYIRVYIEKPELLYKSTVIIFSDSCTEEVDNCCDAPTFGGAGLNSITTNIGNNPYLFNCFPKITEDRTIPLNVSAFPDTGLFIIGVDLSSGDVPVTVLLDSQIPGYHQMPYICQGPVSNERFSLRFEYPVSVDVTNACGSGFVVVDNDEPNTQYVLESEDETMYLPAYTDTIYDLPDGNYTLSVYDSIEEHVSFSIASTIIDAALFLPYTFLYIGDSYVTPILNIYTPYNEIAWDFGDGTTAYNDINPVHYYSQPGVYILKATVNEGQCSRVFEALITVQDALGISTVNRSYYKPTGSYYAIDGKLVKKL